MALHSYGRWGRGTEDEIGVHEGAEGEQHDEEERSGVHDRSKDRQHARTEPSYGSI